MNTNPSEVFSAANNAPTFLITYVYRWVRFPAGAGIVLYVQTDSASHTPIHLSHPYRGLFRGVKAAGTWSW